ncbi:MAG: T9SS type A sorting domain-containing protein [Bacteroidota bacterium]|nr:T9SS type A sorting domain-containing protein [Bacteroidota bacterium]
MKRNILLPLLVVALSILGLTTTAYAQKVVTIPQIQQVSIDSLLSLDTLQTDAKGKTLDKSPNWKGADANADTVTITGVVIVKPRILTYTLARYNIFVQDTNGKVWAGINVLTNDTSSQAQGTGITALDSGDVVTLTGRVTEFASTGQNNSLTELFIYNIGFYVTPPPISVGTSIQRPQPVEVTCDSFAVGTKPRFSSGEKYESMYAIVRDVTVNTVDYSTGRFTFVDSKGNQMSMYDGSGYYTLRGHKITGSKYSPPPVGTKLSYIRGVILPQAKSGTAGEYTIMPLYPGKTELTSSTYPGDIKVGQFAPSISTLNRALGKPPTSSDAVVLTFKAKELNAGAKIDSTAIYYQVGLKGTWIRTKATMVSGDTSFTFTIPPASKDSIVSYYVGAYSSLGLVGYYPDPTIPRFYRVRDGGISIFDVQYTPYSNGSTGYFNDTVTVSGIVVADTTDIKDVASNRPRIFIASKSGAWNGIPIYGTNVGVGIDVLVRGDSINITGIARETNSRTVIEVTALNSKVSGVAVPAPTVVSISGAGSVSYELSNPPVDGTPLFEQWEGVLIQINNPYLVQRNADNPAGTAASSFGEYLISSSKYTTPTARYFGLRVDDNGRNTFYADTSTWVTGTTGYNRLSFSPPRTDLIPLGAKISSLVGILDYSFSSYKLEPRKNSDFGTITGVIQRDGELVPAKYELSQNFPNPFNPTTSIRYSLPVSGAVTMKIFNILGQEVSTVVNTVQNSGSYIVNFDATRLSSGVYFYELRAGQFVSVKKMMLLK